MKGVNFFFLQDSIPAVMVPHADVNTRRLSFMGNRIKQNQDYWQHNMRCEKRQSEFCLSVSGSSLLQNPEGILSGAIWVSRCLGFCKHSDSGSGRSVTNLCTCVQVPLLQRGDFQLWFLGILSVFDAILPAIREILSINDTYFSHFFGHFGCFFRKVT